MFCTECGAKNDDRARFCVKCGTPLMGRTAPSSEGVTVPPATSATPSPTGATPGPQSAGSSTNPQFSDSAPESSYSPRQTDNPTARDAHKDGNVSPYPTCDGNSGERKQRKGKVVAALVAAVAVVAVVGILSFALGPTDFTDVISSVFSNLESSDSSDDDASAASQSDGQVSSDTDSSAVTDSDYPIFLLSSYEGSLSDVEDLLETNGLEFIYGNMRHDAGSVSVDFDGIYTGKSPISNQIDYYVNVYLMIDPGSTDFSSSNFVIDEDGDAEITSLDMLASDAQITYVFIDIDCESVFEVEEYASVARELVSAIGITTITHIEASDDTILESGLKEFNLDNDQGYSDSNNSTTNDMLIIFLEDAQLLGDNGYATVDIIGNSEHTSLNIHFIFSESGD